MTISTFIPGIAVPQGSMRGFVRGGRVAITSDNTKLRSWRADVTAALSEARDGREPIDGPVEVSLVFRFLRPASHYGTRGTLRPSAPELPVGKPDVDKIARAIFDAATVARVWVDDSRVTSLYTSKRYCRDDEEPGVDVLITSLGELVA